LLDGKLHCLGDQIPAPGSNKIIDAGFMPKNVIIEGVSGVILEKDSIVRLPYFSLSILRFDDVFPGDWGVGGSHKLSLLITAKSTPNGSSFNIR
jgi:hypothetical protein